MKKLVYPATFEPDGEYIFVQFPDIEEAFTQGETIQEAYEMAEEVLGVVLADRTEYPTASSLEKIMHDFPDKQIALVTIDLDLFRRKYRSKTIRKNISIPEWLNDLAIEHKINVSQVTTQALKETLGI